jgi:hypothetical protein
METYILRIYRRSPAVPGVLHGTVERVGAKARNAFGSREELWALLEAPPATDQQPLEHPDIDQQDQ